MQTSPTWPSSTVALVTGSAMRRSTWGTSRPKEPRSASGSTRVASGPGPECGAHRLGHAERVVAQLGVLGGGGARRGRGEGRDGRQVPAALGGPPTQLPAEGRPGREAGGLLALHHVEGGVGLEALQAEQRVARGQGHVEGAAHAADPEEGHGAEDAVARAEALEAGQVGPVAQEVAVGVDHALGIAGGARGVDGEELVARGHLGLDGSQVLVGHHPHRPVVVQGEVEGLGPGPPPAPGHPHVAQVGQVGQEVGRTGRVGQPGDGLFDEGLVVGAEEGGRHQQGVDVAVAQGLAQLGRLVGGGEGHAQGTDAGDGQPGQHPVGPVGEHDAHPGALAHPGGQQVLGHPARGPLGPGVGHGRRGGDDEGWSPKVGRRMPEHAGHGGRVVQFGSIHGIPPGSGRTGRPRGRL